MKVMPAFQADAAVKLPWQKCLSDSRLIPTLLHVLASRTSVHQQAWHNEDHSCHHENVTRGILQLIVKANETALKYHFNETASVESNTPIQERLSRIAVHINVFLYASASSLDEYCNEATLVDRIQSFVDSLVDNRTDSQETGIGSLKSILSRIFSLKGKYLSDEYDCWLRFCMLKYFYF
jgi:hypothetical protein